MIVTLLFSVNPDAAFAVTVLEACPVLKPEEDDLGLLAMPIPKYLIGDELRRIIFPVLPCSEVAMLFNLLPISCHGH